MFGDLKVGGVRIFKGLDDNGRLSAETSPFAAKFIKNLDHYRPLETAKVFFELWAEAGESVTSILHDEDINAALNKISSSELRAAFWTKQHCLWHSVKKSLNRNTGEEYVCELYNSSGVKCGKVFNSYNSLIVHQTHSTDGEHGKVSPL